MKPLVSIIIPTHNRVSFLGRALKSVLNQSYQNIEVIVVDDGSRDDTAAFLKSVEDSRLRVITHATPIGACKARNDGLDAATGEFINFLDDDDTLLEKKIETQVDKFSSVGNEVGVISCDVKINFSDQNEVIRNHAQGNIYRDMLRSYAVFGIHTMLFRKVALKHIRYDEDLVSNQEYDVMIRVSQDWEFDYVPKVLCEIFESKNQIGFNFKRKIQGTRTLFAKHWSTFRAAGWSIFVYNVFRYSYLMTKYTVGLLFGRRAYRILP